MNVRDIVRLFRTSWVLLVSLVVVGVVGAGVGSLLSVPQYTASTTLFVTVSNAAGASPSDLVQSNNFTLQRVSTYASIIPTERVLTQVISDLKLNTTPEELATKVTATVIPNSVNIQIDAVDPDPQAAATLVTAVSSSFQSVVVNELEATTSGSAGPVKVEVLQPATVPQSPSSPNLPLNVALGAAIGLVLGLVIAIIRLLTDTRVHKLAEAARLVNAPILGGTAKIPKSKFMPLSVVDDPKGPQAESYRSIQTAVSMRRGETMPRSIVITSAIGGEGRTTFTANLATAFAEVGLNVLVIDADLRAPAITSLFGFDNSPGLTDVLGDRVSLAAAVRTWDVNPNLKIIPAGNASTRPSEVLSTLAMAHLINTLQSNYDLILLDSPALLPVTDAAVLSSICDGVIMVTAAGTVKREEVRAAVSILRNISVRVIGVVVTMLPSRGPDSYSFARYGSDSIDDMPLLPAQGDVTYRS